MYEHGPEDCQYAINRCTLTAYQHKPVTLRPVSCPPLATKSVDTSIYIFHAMSSLSLFLIVTAVLGITANSLPETGYEATNRYNVLPWDFKLDKLFGFAVTPLKHDVINPPTYAGYPRWPFVGGPGYLVAIKFGDSPIGRYSELFYLPGLYKPHCSVKPYMSVQRIWVDSVHSRHAGRTLWGIPKELATFDWRESPPFAKQQWTSLTLTDDATGAQIISFNMTDIDGGLAPDILDHALTLLGKNKQFDLPSWLLPTDARTVVQWPIDDTNNTFLATKEEYYHSPIARYTTLKNEDMPVDKMPPVLTELTFLGKEMVFAYAKGGSVEVDAKSFTGSPSNKLTVVPMGVHLKEGSDARLSVPGFIRTCAP